MIQNITTPARPGWLVSKTRQFAGKVRRFYLHRFRRDYVEAQIAKRQGDCGRCAACCKLLFKCPFLDESGPIATCSIHDRRPDNCRFFPIDPRDLADRDFVDPTNPCGFSFPDANVNPRDTSKGHTTARPGLDGSAASLADVKSPIPGHPSAMSEESPIR